MSKACDCCDENRPLLSCPVEHDGEVYLRRYCRECLDAINGQGWDEITERVQP